jgi:hypothetical protein
MMLAWFVDFSLIALELESATYRFWTGAGAAFL